MFEPVSPLFLYHLGAGWCWSNLKTVSLRCLKKEGVTRLMREKSYKVSRIIAHCDLSVGLRERKKEKRKGRKTRKRSESKKQAA